VRRRNAAIADKLRARLASAATSSLFGLSKALQRSAAFEAERQNRSFWVVKGNEKVDPRILLNREQRRGNRTGRRQ
jgi:hypothetical protein